MNPNKLYPFLVSAVILLTVLACNALVPAPTLTPSPVAPAATLVPNPESQPFVISASSLNQISENPAYTVNAQIPVIRESTDPRALAFNNQMQVIVEKEIDAFKQNVSGLPADPNLASSSFDTTYNMLLQTGTLAAFKFDFAGYTSGAAHPYHYSTTVNYDFEQNRQLSLDELFLPGSNYLELISTYCIAQLSQRDIGFEASADGAQPTAQNYRNWNITSDGLMITFDEYQVAPYAAGPQLVVVPYTELQTVINPEGPLAAVTR